MKKWLFASVVLNVILVAAFLWTRPGVKLRAAIDGAEEYEHAVQEFRSLSSGDKPVVFLGDSLTAGAPFCDLATGILNRGLPGDDVRGVMGRVDEVIERKPAQLWLMIGTNDLKRGGDPDDVAAGIQEIVRRIRKGSPGTELFLQSILPTRPRQRGSASADAITAVNEQLHTFAKSENVPFVDLTTRFADDDGLLSEALTVDGLHLSPAGYQVWFDAIKDRLVLP